MLQKIQCTHTLNRDNPNDNNVSLGYLLQLIVTSLTDHNDVSYYILYSITPLKKGGFQ